MIYDLLFLPYRGLERTSPVILLERIVYREAPKKAELGWLLTDEGIVPREPGVMLMVPTGGRGLPEKEYWYTPQRNMRTDPPSTLPHVYPYTSPRGFSADFTVGERVKGPEERKHGVVAAALIWTVKTTVDIRRWIKTTSRKE